MKKFVLGAVGCFAGAVAGMVGLCILTMLGLWVLRASVLNDVYYILLFIGFVGPVGAVLGAITGCAGVFLASDERRATRILLIGGWLCAVPLGLFALVGFLVSLSLSPRVGFSTFVPLFGLPLIWSIMLIRNAYQMRELGQFMRRFQFTPKKQRVMLLVMGIMIVTSVVLWGWHKSLPPNIEQRLNHGNMLLAEAIDSGNAIALRNAAVEYRSIIRMQPQNAEAYMGLGAVYLELSGEDNHGYLVKALTNWRKATLIEPRSAYAHAQLGETLYDLGQHTAAKKEWRIERLLSPQEYADGDPLPPGARAFEDDD